jgi:hypothetical protein
MASRQAGSLAGDLDIIPELLSMIEDGEFYDPWIDILVADNWGVRIDVADAERRLGEQQLTKDDGF